MVAALILLFLLLSVVDVHVGNLAFGPLDQLSGSPDSFYVTPELCASALCVHASACRGTPDLAALATRLVAANSSAAKASLESALALAEQSASTAYAEPTKGMRSCLQFYAGVVPALWWAARSVARERSWRRHSTRVRVHCHGWQGRVAQVQRPVWFGSATRRRGCAIWARSSPASTWATPSPCPAPSRTCSTWPTSPRRSRWCTSRRWTRTGVTGSPTRARRPRPTESDIDETIHRLVHGLGRQDALGGVRRAPDADHRPRLPCAPDPVRQEHASIRTCLTQLCVEGISENEKQEIRRTPLMPQDELRAGMGYFHDTI